MAVSRVRYESTLVYVRATAGPVPLRATLFSLRGRLPGPQYTRCPTYQGVRGPSTSRFEEHRPARATRQPRASGR